MTQFLFYSVSYEVRGLEAFCSLTIDTLPWYCKTTAVLCVQACSEEGPGGRAMPPTSGKLQNCSQNDLFWENFSPRVYILSTFSKFDPQLAPTTENFILEFCPPPTAGLATGLVLHRSTSRKVLHMGGQTVRRADNCVKPNPSFSKGIIQQHRNIFVLFNVWNLNTKQENQLQI